MRPAAALAACALLTACVTARPGPAPSEPGYLSAAEISAAADGLVPTPATEVAGQPGEAGADRWWLAIAHAELRPPEAAQHFDCALGTRLAARPRPALTRLMTRLLADADAFSREAARRRGPSPRPFVQQPGLEPCQRLTPSMRDSPSWPASGAVVGTVYGEAFAALAPGRAAEVRRTGHELGVSRAVCRMNSETDVEDGQAGGRRLFARIAASPDFGADLEAARAEVVAARAEGLTNPACAAERRALEPRAKSVELDAVQLGSDFAPA